MADYTRVTNFTAKDSLPLGDPEKVVSGQEIQVELDAIATAIASKPDAAGTAIGEILAFAAVEADGTDGGSSDRVTSVAKDSTGVYTVIFSVPDFVDFFSTFTVSLRGTTGGSAAIEVINDSGDEHEIVVRTFDYTGTPADHAFTVIQIGMS